MAMSWVLHDVMHEDLRPGDHIYRWGSPVHNHHGIVLQVLEEPQPPVADVELQDRIVVLHFTFNDAGLSKVHSVPLREFLEGNLKAPLAGGLKRARYGCAKLETWIKRSGTCYAEAASSAAECLMRARSLLEASELRTYDFETLTSANCEHFAFWCKTGIWRSAQVESARFLGAAALAIGAAAMAGMRGRTQLPGLVGLVGGVYLWNQGAVAQRLESGAGPSSSIESALQASTSRISESSGNRLQIHLPEGDSRVAGDSEDVDDAQASEPSTPDTRINHPRNDQELCEQGFVVLDTPKTVFLNTPKMPPSFSASELG